MNGPLRGCWGWCGGWWELWPGSTASWEPTLGLWCWDKTWCDENARQPPCSRWPSTLASSRWQGEYCVLAGSGLCKEIPARRGERERGRSDAEELGAGGCLSKCLERLCGVSKLVQQEMLCCAQCIGMYSPQLWFPKTTSQTKTNNVVVYCC